MVLWAHEFVTYEHSLSVEGASFPPESWAYR